MTTEGSGGGFKKDATYYRSLIAAIQSLDSLNDQIVQFIFAPNSAELRIEEDDRCDDPAAADRCQQQREALKSSMALMRRLLVDAQAKFRKMMEDNKALASRIDGDLQNAHQEVSILRAELVDTNKRISEIATRSDSLPSASSLTPPGTPSKGEQAAKQPSSASYQGSPVNCARCMRCTHEDVNQLEERLSHLQEHNEKLTQLNRSLQREVEELQVFKEHASSDKEEYTRSQSELKNAKDALAALKQDRKRLKAEKFDLLNQMKQLYGTLEDKEKELRDFIRNYEQRMKESDESLKQLMKEREDSEREKWNILKHARDEAERCVALRAQLGLKEGQIKQLQEELCVTQDKLGYLSDVESRHFRSNGYRSPSASSAHTPNGQESSATPTPTPGSEPATAGTSYAGSGNLLDTHIKPTLPGLSRSAEEIYNSSGSSDTSTKKSKKRREGKSTWGSISRVFTRSKQRKALEPGIYDTVDQRSSWSPQSSLCASPLTEDSYAEKLRLLEEAQGTPMDRWKAATVLAWLEITLGMPQYGAMCSENIKSGKILLELSDLELETGLGISNVMHRRKLRLAIEEHREPSLCPYPKICLLTHSWVVDEWLPSLGLACYAENFAAQLIDGRVLDTLTKKDLEKCLGISRKFHQVSIMHAIQLLRMVRFDRQLLAQRRSLSESMDVDPLVWTNQRFIKWAKSIDLGEYAENLRDSGVHGALVVLEPSFTADTMATALGIPASKNIIRRHLTTELENLIQPARMSLEAEAVVNSKRSEKRSSGLSGITSTGSLGRNFMRSNSRGTPEKQSDKRRSSVRNSLTKVLGLKPKQELTVPEHFPNRPSTPQPPKPSKESNHQHRRVFSYGAIETITVTPV